MCTSSLTSRRRALRVDVVAADVERVEGAEHPVGVLGDQAGQQVGDPLAGPAVELAEHAVVERGDHAAGEDAEVARVRVGVEEAELEDLLEQDPAPRSTATVGGVDAQSRGCPPGRRPRRRR